MLLGLMADDIERVRQAALKDPTQLVRFADLLVAAGRSEEAIQACKKGLVQRPDDIPLRLALGRAQAAAGLLEEAGATLLDAVARQQRSKGGAPAKESGARPAARGGELFDDPASDEATRGDSGPVIQDPSIEEMIELPTRVGDAPAALIAESARSDHSDAMEGRGFDEDVPTSIASAADGPQRARRATPEPRPAPQRLAAQPGPSPALEPGRVTTLPARNPARTPTAARPPVEAPPPTRAPEPRAPAEQAGRRSDRVTTLPERAPLEARQWAAGPPRSEHEQPAIEEEDATSRNPPVIEPMIPTPMPMVVAPPVSVRPVRPIRDRAPVAAPVRQGPVDLRGVARLLLGPQDDSDAPAVEDVIARPPPDEMTRAWDSRRGSAFVWLWVALVLLSAGIAGGYVYRAKQRAALLAAAVERADARVLEASADGDFAARDAYAGALRAEPRQRKYTAMVALAASRLAADHGEDTDSAGWAMLHRADREALRKKPEPDARTDRDLRQARGLLALARGETCPALDDKPLEDGDIAARCALQRGDTDGARRILADTLKATGDAKNARALIALASLELGAGDLDAADAAYSKILTAYPGHPRAMVGKLLVAIERGELPKISDAPAGAVRLGLSTEAWFHLARGLVLMNSPVIGAANLEAANVELDLARKGIVHDGRLALLYGRARLMQGKVTEAEQSMRIAERLNPNDSDVSVLDAEVALAKGYEDKVVAALTSGAQTPRKLAVLGRAQALTGHYKEAAATLDGALAKRPGDAVSITYRAIARAHLGDAAGAVRELEKTALTSSTAHYGLGLLAFERRDLTRARTELDKSLAGKNSEAFRARALLGRVLRELGKTNEALTELQRVAREAPALLPVHAALGRIYLDLGRDRDARTELRTVIDGGSPTLDDRLAYAESLVHLGVVDQAEKALTEATEAGVPATRMTRLRLELQSWKGPKEAALAAKAFDKERKGPAAKETRLTLATADAYRRAGDAKRAGDLYREALLGDALHANLGIARLRVQQNDLANAENSFRAALEATQKGSFSIDDQTEASVGLGRALLARKASSEAQTILEQAVEKDDTSAEAHFYLARAYLERADLDKARTHAERAVSLDDSYADAFALVGDLMKTSQPDRAKSAYKKFLELQPDGDRAKSVKKSLATLSK